MNLELTYWQAVILREMLNMSNVKGAPMDEDCLSLDDMVIENLKGKGHHIPDRRDVTQVAWALFDRLDEVVGGDEA